MAEHPHKDLLNKLRHHWNVSSRREFFTQAGSGLAGIALAAMIAEDGYAAAVDPLAPKKPHVAPSSAPIQAKSAHTASRSKPAPKGRQKATAAREGGKTAKIMALLGRPKGATLDEIMKATGWQAHSVCGFISATFHQRMKLEVQSTKRDDGIRVYSLSQ